MLTLRRFCVVRFCLPQVVQCQIIQTVAILVQNVQNETSLYYLLSNNYINEIISSNLGVRATMTSNALQEE